MKHLSTSTTNPFFTETVLFRNRLFSKLLSNSQRNILTIRGGAGTGKSLLISSFVSHFDINHISITLNEPVSTIDKLLISIIRKDLSASEEKILLSKEDMLNKWVTYLSNKLEEFWIIIDRTEFLHLDDQQVSLLIKLANQMPSNIKLVFIGKRMPIKLPFSVWKSKGKLLTISQGELAFTKEETRELFQTVYNLPLDEFELVKVFEMTEGWPVAMALFKEAMKDLYGLDRLRFLNKFNEHNDIYQYLTIEVLEDLPGHLRSFLNYVSLCRTVEVDILHELFPDSPVRVWLRELEDQQLFIFKDTEGNYRLHELFRRFLYEKATVEFGREKMKSLHDKLSVVYQGKYRLFEAFSHSLTSKNEKMTIHIANLLIERYKPEHLLSLIDGWVENSSPSLSLAKISLFLFRCIPVILTEKLIQPLKELACQKQYVNQEVYLNTEHRLGTIYFYKGDLKNAATSFTTSLDVSRKLKDVPMIALNLTLLAQVYRFMNNEKEAESLAREALLLSDMNGFEHGQLHASWTLAEIMLNNNQLESGRRFAEQAILVSEKCDDTVFIYPMCSMSKYFRKKGQIKEALKWAEDALHHAEKFEITTDLGWVYTELAFCKYDNSQLLEAEKLMRKSREYFSAFHHHGCLVDIYLYDILLKQGKQLEASNLLNEIQSCIIEKNFEWIEHPNTEQLNEPMLELKLLGTFNIQQYGKNVKINRTTSLKLLLLLATHYERRWSKEEIIGILFPEESEDSASNKFYVALSSLRKNLEPTLKNGRGSRYIKFDGTHYQFLHQHINFDLSKLEDLMSNKNSDAITEVLSFYKGELLKEYPYEEFLIERRGEIRTKVVAYLKTFVNLFEGDFSKLEICLKVLELLIKLEPFDESNYYSYIKLLLSTGNKTMAYKVGVEAVHLLRKELGISIQEEIDQILC